MATSLPTDIDSTYPDASPGDALHQQHHDAIHAYTNTHDTAVDPHTVYAKKSGDTFTAKDATSTPLVVAAATAQTANLVEVTDEPGTVTAQVGPDGTITLPGTLLLRSATNAVANGAVVQAFANGAAVTPLILHGAAGQTGNLFDVRQNDGTVVLAVTAAGRLAFNALDGTAALGAYQGYVTVMIGGVARKLPVYA